MAKLTRRQKRELPETLERLAHRAMVLSKAELSDYDTVAYGKIRKAMDQMNLAVERLLVNQKARSKVFLSDKDIDEIFENLKKEGTIS